MSDKGETGVPDGRVNKGLGLVAAFRAARISQRPALKAELRNSRAALRQQRLDRLALHEPSPLVTVPAEDTAHHDDAAHSNKAEHAAEPVAEASIFATFLDSAAAAVSAVIELPPEPDPQPAQQAVAVAPDAVATVGVAPVGVAPVGVAPVGAARQEPQHAAQAAPAEPVEAAAPPKPELPRVPLSTIGFGPGMMIRMSHLGIETVAELAAADPAWLKSALGDISRLINVELWIASARNACSQAA